jgi:hypothetical protein
MPPIRERHHPTNGQRRLVLHKDSSAATTAANGTTFASSTHRVVLRTSAAVAICIVALPVLLSDRRPQPPTVEKDTLTIRQVFSGRLSAGEQTDVLVVQRPAGAREAAELGVFLVNAGGTDARRVTVRFGRAASPLIEVVSGLSAGDRIIVSDLSAWDQFDRLRLR